MCMYFWLTKHQWGVLTCQFTKNKITFKFSKVLSQTWLVPLYAFGFSVSIHILILLIELLITVSSFLHSSSLRTNAQQSCNAAHQAIIFEKAQNWRGSRCILLWNFHLLLLCIYIWIKFLIWVLLPGHLWNCFSQDILWHQCHQFSVPSSVTTLDLSAIFHLVSHMLYSIKHLFCPFLFVGD